MKLRTFLHRDLNSPTTLSEIKRAHDWIGSEEYLGIFAYATQSGASSFSIAMSPPFWAGTQSRWLFGLDYGRTQPQALRIIGGKPNAEVRVYDGAWIVEQQGFLPRRDFHAKSSILANRTNGRSGMIVGSGNFSSNGLRKSIEAGASLCTEVQAEYESKIRNIETMANDLWAQATPLDDILEIYEERWKADFASVTAEEAEADQPASDMFWIEAGYVTQNRGPDHPGNQIDFPRGMSRFFGFNPPANLARNSVIGTITFEPPSGGLVSRDLRLGNNLMEKITLPIPETHGLDLYDGKVLVFRRSGNQFKMWALEADDFLTAFGNRLYDIKAMGSGRRYGQIAA
jgi:HKD family nuclease